MDTADTELPRRKEVVTLLLGALLACGVGMAFSVVGSYLNQGFNFIGAAICLGVYAAIARYSLRRGLTTAPTRQLVVLPLAALCLALPLEFEWLTYEERYFNFELEVTEFRPFVALVFALVLLSPFLVLIRRRGLFGQRMVAGVVFLALLAGSVLAHQERNDRIRENYENRFIGIS